MTPTSERTRFEKASGKADIWYFVEDQGHDSSRFSAAVRSDSLRRRIQAASPQFRDSLALRAIPGR